MPQTLVAISNPLTFRELKEFATTGGPAVTVYMPSDAPGGASKKLSARIRKMAEGLGKSAEFIEPFESQAKAIEEEGAQAPTLVLFRSPETFRYFWVPREMEPSVTVADSFYVRPILDLMREEQKFYLLAIAQKDVRLLRCTERSSEVVELPAAFPKNLIEFTALDQPDHNLQNKNSSGSSPGTNATSRNVTFGTSSDKEQKPEHLNHYYVAMNRAVVELLKGEEKTPLVIAGVDYELAMYRGINTHPLLCDEGVQGAANALRGPELHDRALRAVQQFRGARITDILAQHEKQAGGSADAPVGAIVKAAYDGRVAHLLVGKTTKAFGNFDEATHRVHQHQRPATGDEDLINAAAVQTVLHAGEVHVVEDSQVPGGRPMAAVMRY